MSKLIFLFGNPVAHSISPMFWNETFNRLGIAAHYSAVPITESQVEEVLKKMSLFGAIGANITIPFKRKAAEVCDILNGISSKIKVVNTIKYINNKLEGWNTDYSALVSILKELGKIDKALIIGDGASSKTAYEALNTCGYNKIIQIARKIEKSEILEEGQKKLIKLEWNEKNFVYSVQESDIIINTTPIGWNEKDNILGFSESLNKDKIFLDFNYSNVSKLINAAIEKKCKVINGLELLLRQALDSFKIFFDEDAPQEVMREAVYKHFCR